ncbi:MAG: FG-GAP repeat protein, partial [Planctomycetota bacterium]
AYLKASPTAAADLFGAAVALQGDVLVVGAAGHDGAETNSGAAFVFRRSGTTWTQEAVLKASTEMTVSFFGTSVALDGDAIVVGAWRDSDGSGDFPGAAYVFRRSGTSWTQEARFQPPAIEGGDQFGLSVAMSGDVVAVGAPLEESGSTGINGDPSNNAIPGAGAVYLFRRSSGVWSQDAYVKPGHQFSVGMKFGTAVALRGATLIVGAASETGTNSGINPSPVGGSDGSGAAFVFRYKSTSWTQEAYLKAAVIGGGDDFFGLTLAFDGQTLVVGAPREDSNATGVNGDATDNSAVESGAVYVFR